MGGRRTAAAGSFYGVLALTALALADDAANDAAWERGGGVNNGTWTADAQVEGQSFRAENCGTEGCNVVFTFQNGKTGTYPYAAARGATVRGVNVKINAAATGCECQRYRIIQIVRTTRKDGDRTVPTDPADPTRRRRGGFNADGTPGTGPSLGWRIDQLVAPSRTSPFFDDGALDGETGAGEAPARVRDAPGEWDATRNAGKEFYTCLVCENDPSVKRRVLACVHWGYHINGEGTVAFDPRPPTASCGAPEELRDALRPERWDRDSPNLDL